MKKRRGLISYCAGIANISTVCLKILLNLYKKERKFIIVFFIETCIIFKEFYTINIVISLQISCKINYLRRTG